MSYSGYPRAPLKVRVMMQISDDCELPDYVPDAEYFPFGLTTASVPANRLHDLERHPGVWALWLQSEERVAWEFSQIAGPKVELQVPVELVAVVAPLLPELVEKGARRVEVFSYNRPGEPPYWLSFIHAGDVRHSLGTPDLRSKSLTQQVPELLRQLGAWSVSSQFKPL